MTPVIRAAEPNDVRAIRRIVHDAYAAYVPRIGREPAPMRADYATLVDAGVVSVAVSEDELVGVLVLRAQPDSLLLENVAVSPAAQGRGIGRALVDFAEQRARELAVGRVTLYTNEHMTENLAFYPALGFREVDRRHEKGFDRVYFEKPV